MPSQAPNGGGFPMRFYWPIAKLDHAERMVWGYASTEAEDDQGEIIRREALEAALADYMRFANIREMHRPSAVGIATEAAGDARGPARAPGDRKVITGLSLTEISVVARPANPEAVFDCWKAAAADPPARS